MKIYQLLPQIRIQERLKVNDDDLAVVEEECHQAIDNLKASDWHMREAFFDWTEQIFRSKEEFEKRLTWRKPDGKPTTGRSTPHQRVTNTAANVSGAIEELRGRRAASVSGKTDDNDISLRDPEARNFGVVRPVEILPPERNKTSH
jgi:hypothetical protein